ncbi:MAG: hypothetical protein ACI4WR_08880 [Bulleidia sp.]
MTAAPAVVFTYNRLAKTEQTLNALNRNQIAEETDLFIFCDQANPAKENDASKVKEVREFLSKFALSSRFHSVHLSFAEQHRGLAASVISGVTEVMNQYGKVIVTEDDLVSRCNYLSYMNDCLEHYQNEKRIWSISGYSYPLEGNRNTDCVYFTYRGSSWGWGTWKDRWDTVDWTMKDYASLLWNPKRMKSLNLAGRDLYMMLRNQKKGVIDSWAVRWVFEQTRDRRLTVYPSHSFLYNIGLDDSGTHHVADGNDQISTLNGLPYELTDIRLSSELLDQFAEYYRDPIFHTRQSY